MTSFSATAIFALAAQCAPNVAPSTVAAIVQTESHANAFALNVNGGRQPPAQSNAAHAAATARRYVAAGYSVDLGLAQINTRNMRRLGLTWATVFDPCANIAALGKVLTTNYQAVVNGREPQFALRIALSLYNTGSRSRGFRNGYVDRVVGNAGLSVPASPQMLPFAVNLDDVRSSIVAENTVGQSWNLFERGAYVRRTSLLPAKIRSASVWSD